MNSWFSYSNAIKIVNSNNSTFSGLQLVNTAVESTPTPDTYAISIDSASSHITINDANILDDRSPPYSRGIFNAGTETIIGNSRETNLALASGPGGQGVSAEPNSKIAKAGDSGTSNTATLPSVVSSGDALSSSLIASSTTTGVSIPPSSCQAQTAISVPGLTANSAVAWALRTAPAGDWSFVNVRPVVADGLLVLYLCNPTSRVITPAQAEVNLGMSR
jgi:hypothetical protein